MKILNLFVIAILLLLLTVCQKEEQTSKLQESEDSLQAKYEIALVMKTLTNPFFITMEKGAREAEKEFDINLTVKTGSQETAINQQIDIIRKLIESKVHAIVIAPASSVELVPILAQAQQAGIVIVNIDNKLDHETSANYNLKDVPFISVDNEEGAYLSAKYISKDVTKPTKAVILEGIRSAQNGIDRKHGAMRAFNENKNIKVVASKTANWKIDEAYEVFQNMWKENKDIELVFCSNDMMALGVVQYLLENKIENVKIAAFDNIEEIRPLLQSGEVSVTIDQQAKVQGYKGIETAIKLLNNEQVNDVTVSVLKVTE
ncbi:substrate-binding domain-containing protein [bacterium]|nr:substrate-binding domain-containing protein [bacterium]